MIQHISVHLFVNFIFALMLVQMLIQWKIGLHRNNLYPQAVAMGWLPQWDASMDVFLYHFFNQSP